MKLMNDPSQYADSNGDIYFVKEINVTYKNLTCLCWWVVEPVNSAMLIFSTRLITSILLVDAAYQSSIESEKNR